MGYGTSPDADIRLLDAVVKEDCVCVEAEARGQRLAWRVGMPGAHIALKEGRGTRHRLRVQGGEILLIDESYNANPASMRAALAALAEARPRGSPLRKRK